LTGGSATSRDIVQGNVIYETEEIGIHLQGIQSRTRDNFLMDVHTSGVFTHGQTTKVGIWQGSGSFALGTRITHNEVFLDTPTTGVDIGISSGGGSWTASNLTNGLITVGNGARVIDNFATDVATGANTYIADNNVSGAITTASAGCVLVGNNVGTTVSTNDDTNLTGNVITGLVTLGKYCSMSATQAGTATLDVGCRVTGCDIGGVIAPNHDCVIVGNRLTSLQATSALLRRCTIEDNFFIGGAPGGARLADSVISGNRFNASVRIGDGSVDGDRNVITDNSWSAAQESGTAQSGAAPNLITLQVAGTVQSDDYYNTWVITITAGTGVGQVGIITDYNGLTRVATVTETSPGGPNWTVVPDATSVYDLTPPVFSLRVTGNHNVVTGNQLAYSTHYIQNEGDDNKYAHNEIGFFLDTTSYVRTIFEGNTVTSSSGGYSLNFDADGGRVVGNTFTESNMTVRVNGAQNVKVSDNYVGPGSVLSVTGSVRANITGNTLFGGAASDFLVVDDCDEAIIANNTVSTSVGGDLDVQDSLAVVIEGNKVEGDIYVHSSTAYNNDSQGAIIKGNQVGGVIRTDANDECLIASNRCGSDILVNGDRCTIQGNDLQGNNIDLSALGGSPQPGNNCNITGNIRVTTLTAPSPGATHMICQNQGGGANWSIGGSDCTIMGNNLVLNVLIVPGAGCIIIGNYTDGIGIDANASGPLPSGTVVVGNKAGPGAGPPSSYVFGTSVTGAHITGTDHNEN
jgi:hypothetical protein